MLRAQYERHGKPEEVIKAVELERPSLKPDEVLIKVLAAPINPSDLLTLSGEYGRLPPLPAFAGNEGVGEIDACGSGVDKLKAGQRVLLPSGCGSWSSHVPAKAEAVLPLPAEGDVRQLAMLTVNPPAALLMLREFVDLKAGDWVLQSAANSGVGLYLVQLAKLRGLRTVNIVRRQEAADIVQQEGGDVVLLDGPDLAERVAKAVDKAPIRLAIDPIGGEVIGRLATCLADGGILVNYGRMGDEPCQIDPSLLIFHDIQVRGFWLDQWFRQAGKEQRDAVLKELIGLIASGKLKGRVGDTFPVSRIKDAVEAAGKGERNGKVMVVAD
ncbi:zinc-dependent alcohol dehydrogenase family protein [Pseudomonas sp. RIT-PI-AD]|uniref:zinc-dependent alcohol dehydrogenase family protein n=1 Tax=Pseudomonas sp. RIT-PI-AD TaxID=3035294 RepID=UPI0021D85A0E|nr:zinc-dependent alcohol dehydrogenase family protein [Pseudomonas sp. RIT-PI-AD]